MALRAALPGLHPLAAIGLLAGACSGETVAQPPPAPVNWQSFARSAPDAGASSATAKESAIAQQYVDALGSPGFDRTQFRDRCGLV